MLNSISKIKKNLQSVQEEIKEDYKKGVLRTKHLRWDSAESDISIAASIKNTIVQWSAAKSLKFQNFSTTSTSSFDLLEKHGEMSSEGGAGHSGQGESISSVTQKIPETPSNGSFTSPPPLSLHLTSTPVTANLSLHSSLQAQPYRSSAVKLSIFYLSKMVNKCLALEYEAIEKPSFTAHRTESPMLL